VSLAIKGDSPQILPSDRGCGGEGENGDQAAMNTSREELLFAVALAEIAAGSFSTPQFISESPAPFANQTSCSQ